MAAHLKCKSIPNGSDMTIEASKQTSGAYKWVLLIVFSMVNFLITYAQFQPAFFATEIMETFGIGPVEFSLITAAPMVIGIIIAFVSGSMADRFGIKKVVLIGLIISSIGALGRYFSNSYIMLVIMIVLMGVSAAIVTANTTKLAIAWFKPSQVSFAVGVPLALGTLGIAVAQSTVGVMFSDYGSAFLAGGIAVIVLTVLWAIIARDRVISPNEGRPDDKPKGGTAKVLKSRNLWTCGIATLLYTGFNVTISSFIITALVVFWGVDPVVAGLVASLSTIGATIGCAVIPPIITRNRHAKILCILIPLVSAGLVFTGWSVDIIAVRCICFPLAGFLYGSINPICMFYPSILPEVTPETSGAAGGLISSVMLAGSVIVPTFIVTPIAGDDYNLLMTIACIVIALIAIAFVILPSVYTGKKKQG